MDGPDIRGETIFTLVRVPAARSETRDWWIIAALAVIGWLGAVAFLGSYRPNQVARTLYTLAPRETLFYTALALAIGAAVALALARRRALAGAALMVAAFLGGHLLYPWLYRLLPANMGGFITSGGVHRCSQADRLGPHVEHRCASIPRRRTPQATVDCPSQ